LENLDIEKLMGDIKDPEALAILKQIAPVLRAE
jgi:hypothetical protein